MFHKILIANRGEIALRILRTCREMGIRTVVAHSQADAGSLPVRLADESICIGPAEARQSYLNIPSIISAASITDSEAIHPGYGLLSENAAFAEICRACGITFIGPAPEAIRLMGDKAQARRWPSRPARPSCRAARARSRAWTRRRRWPTRSAIPSWSRRRPAAAGAACASFARATCSRRPSRPARRRRRRPSAPRSSTSRSSSRRRATSRCRCWATGTASACTWASATAPCQRRHQKLLEESPASAISEETRAGLYKAALTVANSVNYVSAGTVEFLVARNGTFYFIEMNTRIQVEHPVTEMVTGIDLVREQIRIASGEPLGYKQRAITVRGHAIECRINAEDPEHFVPSPGTVTAWLPPGGYGVRVDSHLMPGAVVPPYYDSLIAKIIVHGHDRAEAIARMQRALAETHVEGVKTTIPYHQKLLADPAFLSGEHLLPRLEVGP